MRSAIEVASPPGKALMIYDGDCNFCSLWVQRWQHTTGDHLDYLPFQDPRVAAHFPEVPRGQFETAVQLVETDGRVYGGAEAVFRALAHNPHGDWLLDWYEHSPVFARVTEWGYRLVARHRGFFSALTRLAWGRHLEPPTHNLVRWVFLRSLGLIYLVAFVSLWVQIIGLVGSNGIQPANSAMAAIHLQADAQRVGLERYHLVPTLCWFDASDGFLKLQCAAGATLAILLIFGIAPALCLFLLWLIYLSLCTVCGEFLAFQWDILLLETGFLAIFLAPLQLLPRLSRAAPPSRLVLWLLRWLLFKLMFQSGCVKLLSGDPAWRNLTALTFHYETQPLPTWIGWYAHQLPLWAQKASCATMFGIELFVPFLIFAPRRLRRLACLILVAFQALIFLTGNYCFFNLLTVALCLLLLDDAAMKTALPARLRNWLSLGVPLSQVPCTPPMNLPEPERAPAHEPQRESDGPLSLSLSPSKGERVPKAGEGAVHGSKARTGPGNSLPALSPRCGERLAEGRERGGSRNGRRWPVQITVPLACIAIVTALLQFAVLFRVPIALPRPLVAVYSWLEPLRSFNSYGLFAVMTTSRPEIIIEGSDDGVAWRAYEFKYKPGDMKRRPGFVEPHQPRLDWQMWFAALGSYRQNPWLVSFCVRLLEGSPQVLGLLKRNPFPLAPPRYIRAVAYDYRFTDLATRRKTGAWWRRQKTGAYLPAFSLDDVPEERGRAPRRPGPG